ncbi:MAG: hypothetical protein KKH25_01700, partial [Candidatus Omnitrophica bacterium]|nr:hypothetical protein [Candidatus Omnitrophota bacterium]
MAKNVLKKNIFSLCLLIFISCSTPPTYSRKDIDKVIKNIAQSDFKTKINAWAVGDTVWVFAPIKLFNEQGKLKVNKEGRLDEDLFETTRKISESINRALLNIESLPTFYCFIKSDILRTGGVDLLRLDSYDLVFIPDQIRLQIISWALGIPVSTKELSERVVTVQIPSIDSEILKDIEGNYIHKYDIPLTEFILLLIQQNIIRTFLSAEHKDDYEFNDLTMGYAS